MFKPQCRLVGETKVWFLTFQCDSMIYSNNTVPYSSQISFVYLSHLIAFLISIRVYRQSIHGINATESNYQRSYHSPKCPSGEFLNQVNQL